MNKTNLKLLSGLSILISTLYVSNTYAFDKETIDESASPYLKEFSALDRNSDKLIDKSEVVSDKSVTKKEFKTADKDSDGTLTYDEYSEMKTQISKDKLKTAADDSWITTKAKTKLLEEESLKSLDISVETHDGEVILSGFVKDPALKTKAKSIVAGIKGVKSVKNAIVVKSS